MIPAIRVICFTLLLSAFPFRARAEDFTNAIPVQLNHSRPDTSLVAVPEPSAKALSYYRSTMGLLGVCVLWNLLILALFLFTGLSARMRSWAARLGRKWYFTFALYCIAFDLVYFLVSLPLYYYLGFVHPHNYDLSNQTVGRWLDDYGKGAAVVIILSLATGWVPFLLMKKSPRRWWLYSGLLTLPFLCIMVLIQPVLIDPLFHRFQPLQDKALESKILAQAARAGIEGSRVYEVNMSADTKTVNPYDSFDFLRNHPVNSVFSETHAALRNSSNNLRICAERK